MIIVTKFQILVRTGTAGGPEGPPLIFFLRSFSNMPKPYLPYGKQIQKLINDKRLIIKDARCSFLSVFGKVRKAGSNPASPAHKEKAGIQIFSEVSVFFVTIILLL